MTLEEYDNLLNEIDKLQYKREMFLYDKLKEFLNKDPDDKARQVAHKIFRFAIMYSTNGSSIAYVETKELAEKVRDILINELYEYMLDDPTIDNMGDDFAIDCLFAGAFCLNWED